MPPVTRNLVERLCQIHLQTYLLLLYEEIEMNKMFQEVFPLPADSRCDTDRVQGEASSRGISVAEVNCSLVHMVLMKGMLQTVLKTAEGPNGLVSKALSSLTKCERLGTAEPQCVDYKWLKLNL